MQPIPPFIRPAAPGARDAPAIAALLGELGYPALGDAVAVRLAALRGPEHAVLVAELAGAVIGLIGVHVFPVLHEDGLRGKILALVVASAQQRHGTGRLLLRAAEAFARDRGARRMEVVSGDHRAGAHAFYRRGGYLPTMQRRFERTLDP